MLLRTDFIGKDTAGHLLAALTPANRLVCRVALETGLRIGDILELRTDDLKKDSFSIREQKTGKRKRIRLRKSFRAELLSQAGKIYVFPHRYDEARHRTRQAVFSDLKRAARLFRVSENVAPHSLRKLYAVDLYKQTGDIGKVMDALNHSNVLLSLFYALSDQIQRKQDPP